MSHVDFTSHRRDQQAEDVAFLLAAGTPLADIERRVGVRLDTLRVRELRAEDHDPTTPGDHP